MILLNWLNALRYRLRQRRRKQQLPGSRSGLASTPGRSKRPSRLTPAQIELLEERVLLSAVTVSTTNDVLDGDTSSITNLMATPGADGFISLREAVVAANNGAGADSISIPTGTYTLSLSGASEDAGATGDLDITDELSITGAGAGNTTVSGGGIDRVFHILADNVSIADLTVTGGDQSQGGGLRIENTAALDRIVVTGNVSGGGIFMRNNASTLTINDSTISNNTSDNGGGLNLFEASTTITNSTISGNTSTGNAGGIFARGGLTLLNSTISGNSAAGVGGGINHFGTSSIINSTITGNIADSDNNDATDGGGIKIGNVNQLTLQNSIVAGNFVDGSSTANDLSGSISFLTNPINNLIGDAGSSAGITDGTNGNIVGNSGTGTIDINTVLNTTLADNGGITLTHALVAGTPALDAGDNTTSSNAGLTTDQRGAGFDRISNTTVDIGAFEVAQFDFGDGPILSSAVVDGARHVATGPTLGSLRDVEIDGLESASADSDDLNGIDDEDGITFGTIQVAQHNATVTVNVQGGSGKLDAWIDFNGDGSFGGTLEQIFSSVDVVPGNNFLTFDVPAENTISGTTFSRFRLSTAGGLSPAGLALNGEVEDHVVTLSQIGGDAVFTDTGQSLGTAYSQGAAIGDVDGDGDLDVFVANRNSANKLYLNDGFGTLTDSGQTSFALSADYSMEGEFADLDGDGDLDLFVAQRSGATQKIFFNNGSGIFTDSLQSLDAGDARSVRLADIDGDGDIDAITGYSARVLTNDGSGVFTESQNLALDNGGYSLSLGDIDGDGDIDAVFPRDGYSNQIWLNDGAGSFSYSGSPVGGYASSRKVDLGDIDGDGDLDLLVGNSNNDATEVLINQGGNQAGIEGVFLAGTNFGGATLGVRLADLDSDGDLDAFTTTNSANKVWFNNGSGVFTDSGLSLGSTASTDVRLADFNGDGSADAFVSNQPSTANRVYFNLSAETELTLDGSNNLVITDINGGTSLDDLVISTNGTIVTVTDPGNILTTTISGASGSGTNTVTVPLSQITGSAILVNTLGGDDSLTVDLSSGNFGKAISFNAGAADGGDNLTVNGGTFASAAVNHVNATDGSITITGNSLISYTGLEGGQRTLNLSGITVTDVSLTYTTGNDDIDLDDAEGPTDIQSSTAVDTRIGTVTGTFSVFGRDGNDTYTVTALASSFPANLFLDGGAGADPITINGAINLASGKFVEIRGDNLTINSGINVSGTGTITLISTSGITLSGANADITTSGGTVTIDADANDDGTGTGTFTSNDAGSAIVTGGGAVSVIASNVALSGTINAGAGNVTFETAKSGTEINLGLDAFDLLVASFNAKTVLQFDGETAAFEGEFATGAAGRIDDLVIGPDGALYVSDQDNSTVLRYDGSAPGSFTIFASGNGLSAARGLAFGPGDDLFVASFNSNNVLRFDGQTGAFESIFATGGGLANPLDIVFGPDGNLYVTSFSSDEVHRYNGTSGAFIDVFVSAASGGLDGPNGIDFGPDGNLYVGSDSTDQVLRYNASTGAFIDIFASGGGLDRPATVRFGPDNDLYVTGLATSAVYRYDGTTGVFEAVVATGNGLSAATGLEFLTDNTNLTLTDSELDLVTTTGRVIVGNANSGNVTFRGPVDLASADTFEIVTGGKVEDAGATSAVFTDTNLVITAAQGIGTTSSFDTAVSNFAANGGSGGVNVSNAGALTIGGVFSSPLFGVSTTAGNISITASGPLTVDGDVDNFGSGNTSLFSETLGQIQTGIAGNDQPYDNSQPSLALNYVIVTQGVFPSPGNPGTDQPFLGEIKAFAGNFAPTGTAFADGSVLSISQNTALFSLLGTTYGGDGQTTFALPDLRGRAPIHAGQGIALGQVVGEDNVVLTEAQIAAHDHTLPASPDSTEITGGGQSVNNVQPGLGVIYIVSTAGTFENIGEIKMFAGNFETAGLFADGRLLDIAQNTALFSKLGTLYGGDGLTTFALPDLRGRAAIHAGQGTGLTNRPLGGTVGVENITFDESNLAAHSHTLPTTPSGTTGTGQPVTNMQPSLAVNYTIATQGIFPGSIGDDTAPALATVRMFAGATNNPAGQSTTNGQFLLISSHTALFSLLETTYGGDGQTTFALPDLRGRVVVHEGSGAGLTPHALGSQFGTEDITLTESQLPSHSHGFTVSGTPSDDLTINGNISGGSGVVSLNAASDILLTHAVTTTGGDISINADTDSDGDGNFIQQSQVITNPITFFPGTTYLSQADIPAELYDGGSPTFLEDFEDGTLNGGIVALDLEDFEDGTLNGGIVASDGVVQGATASTDSVDADASGMDGDGTEGQSFFVASGSVFFVPASPVTAAGIVVTGTNGADVFFEAFTIGATSLGVFGPVTFPPEDGPVTEDRFFGISFPGGIEAIRITTSNGPLEVDHIQYGNAAVVNTDPFINSNGGDISITANDVDLQATINAADGMVSLLPSTTSRQITLGETIGATFTPVYSVDSLLPESGIRADGVAAFDQVGYSVSGAEDVNGDGLNDIILGARLHDSGAYDSGAAYVLFGQPGGLAPSPNLSQPDGTTLLRLDGVAASDYAGSAVSSAGDVNGDGLNDLLVGAWGADPNGGSSGAAYVVFGQSNGFPASINLGTLSGLSGFRINGAAAYDETGKSVASAGDVNGDGIDDVVIGAPYADNNGSYSGSAYVVFGRTNGFAPSLNVTDLNGLNGFRVDGAGANDALGFDVSSAEDFNGDGIDDLLISGSDGVDPGSGTAYVIFGTNAGFPSTISVASLNGMNGLSLAGGLGSVAVSSAGDINNDGFDDIVASTVVVFGQPSMPGNSIDLTTLNGTNGFNIVGAAVDDNSTGRVVGSAGDISGDGIDDLLVAAYSADINGGTNTGVVYVVLGNNTGFGATVDLATLDGTDGFRIDGGASGDLFGISVSGVDDVNGDFIDDIAIGAIGTDFGGSNSGSAYILYGEEGPDRFTVQDAELDLITTTSQITIGNATAGNITITGAVTPANATTLELTTAGNVNNAGGSITTTNLAITASGVGTTGLFDVAVSALAGTAGTNGFTVQNTGNLNVSSVAGINGVTAAAGLISIVGTGSITVEQTVTTPGDILLHAGQDVVLNAAVSATGAGSVTLEADNDLTSSVAGAISTVTGGISLVPDNDDSSQGVFSMAGNIDHGTGGTSVDLSAGASTISGAISGAGGLTKAGDGSLVLAGVGTFTGPTSVTNGDLTVSGSLASNVDVAAGATLRGTGTINGAVINNGTTAPGNSPGILNTGDFTFGDNSSFDVELGGPTPGNTTNDHDQLNVAGTVTIENNVTLNTILFGGFVPSSGDSFVIINNDGTDPITTTFAGLPEGAIVAANVGSSGESLVISYAAGTNSNDVVLTAVTPETTIDIVNGNLVVTDANGGNSNDNLTFTADGSNLTITDNIGNFIDLLGMLNGDTGDGSASVTIDLLTFAGGTLDINTLGGDDTINIGTLTLLTNQSIDVDGGTGSDTINVTGALAASGTGSVSLNVSRNILVVPGASIATTDGVIVLRANAAGTTFGDFHGVDISAPITTVDGNITLIGNSGDGPMTGDGVRINNVTVASTGINAGTLSIAGESLAATGNGLRMIGTGSISSAYADINIQTSSINDHGLNMRGANLIESTGTGPNAATITINAATQASSGNRIGIRMDRGDITSIDGNVDITASSNGFAGILMNESSITSTGTTTDAATLLIQGTGTGRLGVAIQLNSYIESVTGDIDVTGQNGSIFGYGVGVANQNCRITSTGIGTNAANITISGNGVGDGVFIANNNARVSAIDGDISISGESTQRDGVELASGASVEATGTGNITFNADNLKLDAGVQGSGTVTFRPLTPGTSIGIGDGVAGTLNLSTAEVANIQNGFNVISIGDGNNGTVTVNAVTFNDPVSITGLEIFVNGQLSGSDNASVTLRKFDEFLLTSTTFLNAPIVTSGNEVTIDDSVKVGTNASIDTTNGGALMGANVTFIQPVDSQLMTSNNLTINAGIAGVVTFQAPVGGNDPLQDLTIDALDVAILGGQMVATRDISISVETLVLDEVSLFAGQNLTLSATENIKTSGTTSLTADNQLAVLSDSDNNGTGLAIVDSGTTISSTFGNVIVKGTDLELFGIVTASQGIVTLTPTNGGDISLGAETPAVFSLTDAEVNNVTSALRLVLGSMAAGDITFFGTISPAAPTEIAIVSAGVIEDAGPIPVLNATNVILNAGNGVGTTGPLDIAATNLSGAVNSGGFNVLNNGNLNVTSVGALNGVTATAGAVSIAATGSITVDQPVTTPDDISLNAGQNVALNAAVSATGLGGVTLEATNDITSSAAGTISATTGPVNIVPDNDESLQGTASLAGNINHGGGGTNVNLSNGANSIDGVIDGTGGLTQAGTGSLDLTAANTFSGLTNVTEGRLLVSGSLAGDVDVAAGATLGGTGTIAGAVTNDGLLAPGNSPGVITTGDFAFGTNSSFDAELGGTTPGNRHDQLSVTGNVNLGGATLAATITQPAEIGDGFVIVANDGTDPIVGTFAGLPEGAFLDLDIFNGEFVSGSERFVISYARGTGNDVTLRPASSISGRVFNDINYDGIDNAPMNGFVGTSVRLIAQNGTSVVRSTTTAPDGSYSFTGLVPGAYFVEFVAPTGFHFTFRDVGNDALDSDANRFTGRTKQLKAAPSGTLINDVDAGVKASTISINNLQQSEGLFGQQTAFTFTVSLSGIAQQIITVNSATADGTATLADSDYTSKSGTVTFAVGQQSKTVTVLATGDNSIELDETFFVNLSNAVNATIVTTQGTGTIRNDDTVLPTISISDASLNEGNNPETTQLDFTVSLNFASTETITVNYTTVDGTATIANNDYTASTDTITFLPGETEATISVDVTGDDFIEDTENFSVRLSNVTGNAPLDVDTGLGTIVNDDFADPQLTITDFVVKEGGVGARTNLLFTVRLSSVALIETTVEFATDSDDALAGIDFEAASGTVTFLPGDFQKTIVVTALGDFDFENSESIFVNLSNAVGATIADAQGVGTILNDDQPLQDISIADVSVAEGAAGTTTRVQLTVSLSGPSANPVSVDFAAANGTAIAGQDYTQRTGTITFAPGEIRRMIGLNVLGDATVESNERFFINLFNPVNGAIEDNQSSVTIRNDDAAVPNMTVSDVSISEGPNGERTRIDFKVKLSGPTTQPVTVNFATADGTAKLSEGDYEAGQGTLTFTPGDTERTVTVIFNGDFDVEGDEFLFLNLSNVVGAKILDGQGRALVLNDDAAIPNISISNIEVVEGTTGERTPATFEITLSGPSTQKVTVNYETGFASAISSEDAAAAAVIAASVGATSSVTADFESTSGTIIIPAGETSARVSVVVLGDVDVESNEFFFLNLSNAAGGILVDDQGQASIINDDLDVQSLSVTDVTKLEGLAGVRTSYRFTVSLTGPSSVPVIVDVATADGTATAASGDYDSLSVRLTFAPGETSKEVIVTVNGDINDEGDEQFFLNLSNEVGATIDDNQGLGVIRNDESAVPTLSIDDVLRTEGDSGVRNQFNFVLRLSNAATGPVTVQATTVAGTATSGVDFEATTTTVNFAAGETIAIVTVPVLGDFTDEPSETFFVNLSGASGATIIDDQGRGTIRNDDSAVPNITVDDAFVEEGFAGQRPKIAFIVSLSGPSLLPVEVNFSTMGATATSGIDFKALSGTLRFEPGEVTKAVRVTVRGDLDVEADEMLFLNLDNPVEGILDDDQAVGTIANDDTVPTLAIANVTKSEGSSGQRSQFIFDVVLTGFSATPVTVNYASANGTATTAGLDYTSANGSLNFLPGESLKQIIVRVAGDSAVETDEFFFVNLSNAVGAEVIANQGTGTIRNDDAAVPVLRIDDFSTEEGILGARTQFNFNVSLTAASNQILTVNYSTAAGSATSGVDFVALNETLTFLPGETSQTIIVIVLGDTAFESLETFFVNLSNPQGLELADDQAIGRIVNDDSPTPLLSVSNGQTEEGITGERPSVTFNLTLSSPPTELLTVDFATGDGTAASVGLDYHATNGTITFLPGQQTASVTVTVLGDSNVETNETFFLNLGNLTGNAVFQNDQGTGVILNDDALRPGITISDAVQKEGVTSKRTRFVFNVSLDTPANAKTGPVEVQYQTANGLAIGAAPGIFDEDGNQIINPNADYKSKTGTVTFQPGEQTKQIVVIVLGDSRIEADETFFVNLTSSSANAEIVDDQALATALNDDFPLPGVSIGDTTVVEGSTGQRTVVDVELALSAPSTTSIFVDYQTANGSATIAGQDYQAANGTVEFMPNELVKTVRLVVLGDNVEEATETFFLNLTGASANAQLVDDQGSLTIRNDDLQQVTPDISISDVQLKEGNDRALPEFQFVVTLSAAATTNVTVNYSTAQGTANSTDFVAKSDSLTFQLGETSKTVDIEVRGDEIVESDETFFVDLSNATGGVITDAQGQGTITNDDVAVLPGIRINDVAEEEGSTDEITEFTFTVELTGVFDEVVEVSYFTSQFSASSNAVDRDFFRISNLAEPESISKLTFEPGETTQTITVQVVGDNDVEADETFFVNLFDAVNSEIEDDQGEGFIINDDRPLPQAEISDAIALEGDSGTTTFTFTVTLDRTAESAVSVDFGTANGTTGTSAGADVQAASGTVTFAPGEIGQTIEIEVVGDLIDEVDEQFFVNLTNANGLLIADDQGKGVIIDDDDPEVILAVTDAVNLTDEFGQEGNTGDTIYEFTIQLIGKPSGPVTVQVSTQDGTAIDGQDYDALSQQLTFNVGESTKKVRVNVSGDQTVETDEEFFLNLTNPVGASISDDQGIATIINDDEVVNRDEGLELAAAVEAQVEAALADPTMNSEVPDGINVVKGTNSGGRSDITALLIQIGLDVIERLGLVDAIVAVFDPVNFIVTTPEGRVNGFTENAGVVGQSTNSFYSGDGAVELLVIPNASAGIYNLELAGVNNGEFRAAVSRVDASGQIGTETIEGTLAGELELALDFTRAFPNTPARNAEAEAAFLALFQQFGGDSDAIDLALASFTNAPKSNADQEQISDQNDAAAQLQAAAAAVAAQAKLLATALQGSLPDWASSGLASAFGNSTATSRGFDSTDESSAAMRDFFWESVSRGVLGLPGGVTAVMDLLDPLMPDAEKTETADDESNDTENDCTPAEGNDEGSKRERAKAPQTDEERRQAFLRKRDEDEVALYVPAAAFAGPEWLAKAEEVASKKSSRQSTLSERNAAQRSNSEAKAQQGDDADGSENESPQRDDESGAENQ